MTAVNAARLMALFDAAVDLPTAEQEALLLRECADDPALLDELRALLAEDRRVQGTTVRPLAPELAGLLAESSEAPSLSGTRVGPYELREELGRGGMGVVYRADRVDGSVQQQVAIKLVRRELLDSDMRRRFQLERQTLAAMDHPHIARLIDAAELDDGTPYYVMEYVDGVPITDYCARKQMSIRERIALFRLVCDAVTQAHRNLIVHRDLKPGNILVSTDGAPKLLDFGIAKLMVPNAAELAAEQTATQHRYFSPQYAAPEQVLGAPIGVGCDVYALGLLLFELLANARAFDFVDLSAGQIERLITSVPPPPPSQMAASKGASTKWQRELRGDLDGIVLRCLRKAANERYASVEQLDADLNNYLQGLPVSARGGQRWYRIRKFVARNAIAVWASTLAAFALIVGIIAFAWQADVANKRAEELEAVSNFQADMLAQVDPAAAGLLLSESVQKKFKEALANEHLADAERTESIRNFSEQWRKINATDAALDLIDQTILAPAMRAIHVRFVDQPLLEAKLYQVLANRYGDLGRFEEAEPPNRRAYEIRESILGEKDAATLESTSNMVLILLRLGKLAEAQNLSERTVEILVRASGDHSAQLLRAKLDLSSVYMSQGKLAEAKSILTNALEVARRLLGDDDPLTLEATNNLALLLEKMGRYDEAAPFFKDALDRKRRIFGNENPETVLAINNVGFVLFGLGKLEEAYPYFEESLEWRRRVLGEQHPMTLMSYNNMGNLMRGLGRLDEAESMMRRAVVGLRKFLGEDHPEMLNTYMGLSTVLKEAGKLDEAEEVSVKSVAASRRALGNEHPDTLTQIGLLAIIWERQGKLDEAEEAVTEVLATRNRLFGPDHPFVLKTIINYSDILNQQARFQETVDLLEPTEERVRNAFGTGSNRRRISQMLLNLGIARTGIGDFENAEPVLLEAHALWTNVPGSSKSDLRLRLTALCGLYDEWLRRDDSEALRTRAEHYRQLLSQFDREKS
ncbi:MAG: serine/threonine protein kinase [Xanthomonadales bacterium]|nr:serine/threonine protein kinase [Xanthomonadales bacterium]MCP5476989.1 serine/threonine protein kinase [Rhodanobacteraceae bacterium]